MISSSKKTAQHSVHRTVRYAPDKAALSARSFGSISKAGSRRTAGNANRWAAVKLGLSAAIRRCRENDI